MKDTANLGVADVLAARVDLACIPKTSSGSVRNNTKTKLNQMVIVGKVRDFTCFRYYDRDKTQT